MTQKSSSKIADLISLSEAVTLVTYTRDYIGRLARERKITSQQVDKQWCVSRSSLLNFFEQSALEESVKKKVLSLSRKNDLEVREVFSSKVSQILNRQKTASLSSVLVTTFLLCGGLLGGSFFYTSAVTLALHSPEANIRQILTALQLVQSTASVSSWSGEVFPESTTLETQEVIPMQNGVVLFSSVENTNPQIVEALFSDEVIVTMTSTSTGFVRSQDNELELPFVRIPTNPSI